MYYDYDHLMIIYYIPCSSFQHTEPELFNSFLRETKADLMATRYAPFWDKVVSGIHVTKFPV